MKYLLDANAQIYLIKNKPASVAERINALDEDAMLCMSFFTYAELLKGAERSSRKAEVLVRLEQLTRQVPVIYDTDRSLCEHYAVHFTRLKEAVPPIGANDLWGACHALAQDATLVTNNLRAFERLERLEGLRLENWVCVYEYPAKTSRIVTMKTCNSSRLSSVYPAYAKVSLAAFLGMRAS